MSVITFPDSKYVINMTWGQKRNEIKYRSNFGWQTSQVAVPLWTLNIQLTDIKEYDSGSWMALNMLLQGSTNQLAVWNYARPQPRGTVRGTITLNSSVVQGATILPILATGQAGKTLVAGDMLQLGTGVTQQLVMVTADAAVNGSGIISVNIQPPLRNAFSSGASVIWDKPCALFRRQEDVVTWKYETDFVGSLSYDLIEDWRS